VKLTVEGYYPVALGIIGPAVKSFLNRRGYVISRPTEIERSLLRSYWRQWFSHDPALFAEIYAKNRKTLKSVSDWISADSLERSLWRYGVPADWTTDTNLGFVDRTTLAEIESEVTSADLLGFVARFCLQKLSYLEIGVSVGKTLLQVQIQASGAELVGVDVEEINPVLRKQFDTFEEIWRGERAYPVETLYKGIVQKISTMHRLTSRNNVFDYLSADQFRDDTWARLAGKRFNLVFSDGVHTPEALRSELQFLIKHDLIDRERFIMCWDDLWDYGMQSAFLDNAKTLCRMFNRGDEAISLYLMHGSYGFKRPMGLFSSVHR
jgi:hypothetical protein